MTKFISFFEDNSDGFSMTRLVCFLWIISLIVLLFWGSIANFYLILKTIKFNDSNILSQLPLLLKGLIPDVPPGLQLITGIVLASKVGQRFLENPTIETTNKPV